METNIKITTKVQLLGLLDSKNKKKFICFFPELTETENYKWTERIKKNYFACGCNTSSIFMLLTIISLVAIWLLNKYIIKQEFSNVNYLYGLALIFLMTIIGKIIGKKLSYIKLKKDIHQLKMTLKMKCHQQTYLQKHD